MQKKVYTKDLSIDEVTERLKKGQKAYYKSENYYCEYKNGILVYNQMGEFFINSCLEINMDYYFLDEVEEPEADKSCIGKLCKFWYEGDEPNDYIVSILNEICEADDVSGIKYRVLGISVYDHCKPLTKEEALALVKE